MNEKTFVLIKLNVQNSKKLECECWWTAFGEVTASRWTSEESERPNDEKKKNLLSKIRYVSKNWHDIDLNLFFDPFQVLLNMR